MDDAGGLKRAFGIKHSAPHALFLRYVVVTLQDNTHNPNRFKFVQRDYASGSGLEIVAIVWIVSHL